MRPKEDRVEGFKSIPKINEEELAALDGMIKRGAIMSYDQAARLTGKSSAWLRTGYNDGTINMHRLGKILFCSFNEKQGGQ